MTVCKETHSFCKHREDTPGNQVQDVIIKITKRGKGERIHSLKSSICHVL